MHNYRNWLSKSLRTFFNTLNNRAAQVTYLGSVPTLFHSFHVETFFSQIGVSGKHTTSKNRRANVFDLVWKSGTMQHKKAVCRSGQIISGLYHTIESAESEKPLLLAPIGLLPLAVGYLGYILTLSPSSSFGQATVPAEPHARLQR